MKKVVLLVSLISLISCEKGINTPNDIDQPPTLTEEEIVLNKLRDTEFVGTVWSIKEQNLTVDQLNYQEDVPLSIGASYNVNMGYQFFPNMTFKNIQWADSNQVRLVYSVNLPYDVTDGYVYYYPQKDSISIQAYGFMTQGNYPDTKEWYFVGVKK